MKEIEQVPNTYYYDKLYEDKHLDRIMEICDTCPGRQEKYGRSNADSGL